MAFIERSGGDETVDPDEMMYFVEGKPIPIFSAVNEEELREWACETLSINPDHQIAQRLLMNYIVLQIQCSGAEGFNYRMVIQKYEELMMDYLTTQLHKKGFIDVTFDEDGKTTYQLTDKGQDACQTEQ